MEIKIVKYEIYAPIREFLAYFCDVISYVICHVTQSVMSLINKF